MGSALRGERGRARGGVSHAAGSPGEDRGGGGRAAGSLPRGEQQAGPRVSGTALL